MESPLVSIIIVNYNGKRFLDACLRSIQKKVQCLHEIIVVDNASTDGSREYIWENFPYVSLIASDINLGFAGGNNLGARNATGKHLLLLNNDTVLLTDIVAAVSILENDPKIGIVGVLSLDEKNAYRNTAAHFPTIYRLTKLSSMYYMSGYFGKGDFPISEQTHSKYFVHWVEGSFLMVTAGLWQQLNGLDEKYFMYGEDIDFCYRGLLAGLKTAYCPNVKYIHYGGYSIDRLPLIIKGVMRFHMKHSSWGAQQFVRGLLLIKFYMTRILSVLIYACSKNNYQLTKAQICRSVTDMLINND